MIRIAYLIPTLDRSGAEKQLACLASRLPRDEFQVEVLALTRGGPYADVLEQAGIPVTVLNKRWKFDPWAYRRLQRGIAARQPDILHTWLFAANAYGRLAISPQSRTKVIVSERCVDSWKSGWQLWLDRRLIPRTSLMIGNSQAVVDFYAELGVPRERLRLIRNGIDLPGPAQRSRETILREWNVPSDAQVVTFIGRLAPQKRVDDLLWAMAMLRHINERNVHFIIVGDGPSRTELERLSHKYGCADIVRFTGHRSDTRDFLAASDAFWLASGFEGQSNSLMEAMAAGVPVVVSDIPANRELVSHDQTGLLVPMGDRAAFTQTMQQLLADKELQQRLGQAAIEHLRSTFSIERMVQEHAELYRQTLPI